MGAAGVSYTALPSPSFTWRKTFFRPPSAETTATSDSDSGPGWQLGSAAILIGVRTGGLPSNVTLPVMDPGPSAFAVATGRSGVLLVLVLSPPPPSQAAVIRPVSTSTAIGGLRLDISRK